MKKLIFGCILFFLFLSFPIVGKADFSDVAFYGDVLKSFNQTTGLNKTYICGALIHEQKNCSHLFNMFERDKSTGLFFGMISDSPWDTCKKYVNSSKEISIGELEKKLAENKQTSLGLRNDYFSSKIEQCLPTNKKLKPADLETQKKIIVTMGYDYLNRFKKSTGQLADEVKRLNSILGESIESGLPCGDFSMPHDAKICQDIKSQKCKSNNELGIFVDTLYENAIEPLIALKKANKELSEKFSKTRTLYRPENREILKDLKNKIKSIESQFPLLKGKMLGAFLESETEGGKIPSKSKLQAAVKGQLVENRNNITKKINENIDLNNCIVYGDDSYCKKFNEHLERMPPHQDVVFFEKDGSNRLKNLASTELYNTNQCLDDFRGLKNEFNSFASDFSINVGLTIFTGGAGLLARAGGTGVKAALAGHKAMLVADAAFLGAGVDEAISTCSKELNKLEQISPEKNQTINACPASLASPEHVVVANYQGCVTGAMMASLNALPFVPAVVSKYLSRTRAPKMATGSASEMNDLMKFKAPKKAFDPHDLRTTGTILPSGKVQDPSVVFNRDGVYVYIVDDKGNMVLSHRTPNLNAGTKDGDQFLGTHRGLYNKLSEKGDAVVVAAGEIRVVGGVPITVSPRAGSFHNTPEEVLANMKKSVTPEENKMIDNLLAEYRNLSPEDRSNSMMVDMHFEDYLDDNPAAKETFNKMQKHLKDLTEKRLEVAKEAMTSRGLTSKNVETKFTHEVSGDAHIEGRAAAVAEINCSKDKSCAKQMETYQKLAKKFIEKYNGPKESEKAVMAKLEFKDLNGLSQKEKAFQFFGQRSYLLFKEGPIEFIQNARPEKFGITADEALKYLDEWSKQF